MQQTYRATPFDTKGRMLRLGKKNVQGGFHFTFRCKFWAGWAAPGRQQNLGGTAAPENEMIAPFPYNRRSYEDVRVRGEDF